MEPFFEKQATQDMAPHQAGGTTKRKFQSNLMLSVSTIITMEDHTRKHPA